MKVIKTEQSVIGNYYSCLCAVFNLNVDSFDFINIQMLDCAKEIYKTQLCNDTGLKGLFALSKAESDFLIDTAIRYDKLFHVMQEIPLIKKYVLRSINGSKNPYNLPKETINQLKLLE